MIDALNRYGQRQRTLENPPVRRDPQERRNHRPTEAHRQGAGKLSIPPLTGRNVLHTQGVLRIDEQVGVDENQRKSSPSASASTSAMLSRSKPGRSPMSVATVR